MSDIAQANKLLNQAADLYALGVQHASQYDAYVKRRDQKVKTEIGLLDDKHKALIDPIKDMNAKLKEADEQALKQAFQSASTLLDEVLTQLVQCKQVVADSEACARRLKALKETTVPGLTTHSPATADPVIGSTITALNLDVTKVEQLIKDFKYTEALKKLDAMETTATSAALKRKMKAGGLTSSEITAQCKTLLAQPGGQKELDDLVAGLSGDDAVDAVLAAMKARFKLDDAECLGTKGDNLQRTKELCRIYSVMTIVPDKHTKDNPSFKKIKRQDKGSAYNPDQKAIIMGEGHPDTSSERPLAIPTELSSIKPGCEHDTTTPAPKFFDWNTLHEVGHALDDKKQFMKKNGSNSAYGGWQVHGADLLTVAEAAANEFNRPGITAQLIAKYLDAGTVPTPAPPGWPLVKAWADAVRSGQNPWKNGACCDKSASAGGFQLGGRIYHEGYANQWFSYEASARREGITGYQFRAPGEWFSELYAAYKTKKLKNTHPAHDWLAKLFGEKASV